MKARIGDHIAVEGRTVGRARREGMITEVIGSNGSEHYRVRWDTSDESIFFPQSDCVLVAIGKAPQDARNEIDLRAPARPPSTAMSIAISENDDDTYARVTVQLRDFELTGFGRATRHPRDPRIPAVGDELAAARAMSDLAHQLLDLASYQIEKAEGHPVLVEL
jgi:Domain of unknown function (DUF1876)/Domain of unknown function (DUF1918)